MPERRKSNFLRIENNMTVTPLAPVARPYDRRVTVERSMSGMYAFLLSLHGWTLGTDLRVVAAKILVSLDASAAGARIVASSATVLWLDVEAD
jgi:hypothetical protein